MSELWPDAGATYRGHAELVRLLTSIMESGLVTVGGLEFIDIGDKVVVEAWLRLEGHGSGAIADHRPFHVWTIQDGKVSRLDVYLDRAEALEAAGAAPDA